MPVEVPVFDPAGQQQPVLALTLLVRGLQLGGRVQVGKDTTVKSVAVPFGATHSRRFAVSKGGRAVQFHQTWQGTFATAEEAARNALGK